MVDYQPLRLLNLDHKASKTRPREETLRAVGVSVKVVTQVATSGADPIIGGASDRKEELLGSPLLAKSRGNIANHQTRHIAIPLTQHRLDIMVSGRRGFSEQLLQVTGRRGDIESSLARGSKSPCKMTQGHCIVALLHLLGIGHGGKERCGRLLLLKVGATGGLLKGFGAVSTATNPLLEVKQTLGIAFPSLFGGYRAAPKRHPQKSPKKDSEHKKRTP